MFLMFYYVSMLSNYWTDYMYHSSFEDKKLCHSSLRIENWALKISPTQKHLLNLCVNKCFLLNVIPTSG